MYNKHTEPRFTKIPPDKRTDNGTNYTPAPPASNSSNSGGLKSKHECERSLGIRLGSI
jgi:hypothetical protein